MKPPLLFFIFSCFILQTFGQSGPLLIAKTSEGGAAGTGAGTIIQYTGGDTALTNTDVITSGNPSNCTFTKGPDGKFYGVVDDGAPGTDILIAYDYPSNTYMSVAAFDSSTGTVPQGKLLLVGDTAFYGLTLTGGANGGGTLYAYSLSGHAITKLVDLPGEAYPYGGLMKATDGNLYGVTYQDGAHRSGTIFSYNIQTNAYNVLYSLPSYSHPFSTLVQVGDTLYGMNTNDSIHNTGNIFAYVISSGVYYEPYFFPGPHTFPEGSFILATNGLLYGVTTNGGTYATTLYSGGTLFSYQPGASDITTLYNFGNGTGGYYLLSDVFQASDGMLYGLANEGGAHGGGTIYRYNIATSTYTQMLSLSVSTGYYPGYGGFVEYTPAPSAAPVIYAQPKAITVCADSLAKITLADSGAITSAQWQVSTDGGSTFSNVTGGNDSAYTFSASLSQNQYQYRVILAGNGHADTSSAATITVDTCAATGIYKLQGGYLNIYPNPANGLLQIITGTGVISNLIITDVLGQQIAAFNQLNTPQFTLQTAGLNAGLYVAKVCVDNQWITNKFLVEH